MKIEALSARTHGDPIADSGCVHIEPEIGRRIYGVLDLKFVSKAPRAIVQDNREMQVNAGRVVRVTGVIALITEKRTRINDLLICTWWEFV